MSSSALAAGIRLLRGKMAVQYRSEDSDEQLLHAFLTSRDEDAFAVLVHRHGPMVLHVCRRVLGHEQDAEDAFQATFLVLARNAASLRKKASLVSFLHGTAYRTAMKAKQSAARRRKHEAQTPSRPPLDLVEEISWREVRTLLDEEIARLPDKYRSVFVLCCLENLSRAEAARRLGLKERTVLSRLAEARKRLSQRLARRGVELTAVLAAATLATQTASALPVGLMATTIEAAMVSAVGEGLAGVVSASVVELVQGAMMVSKAKIAVVVLLATTLLGGAGVWAYRASAANAVMTSAQPAEPPAAKADEKPRAAPPKPKETKTIEIQGRVLGPDGKPKVGAKLLLLSRKGKMTALGVTTAEGRFTVAVAEEAKNDLLVAQAEDAGCDFLYLDAKNGGKPIELRLVKDQAIHGRIVNTEGKPVAAAQVVVNDINEYPNHSLDMFLGYWKKRRVGGPMLYGGPQPGKAAGALFATTTDAEGRFVLRGLGVERLVSLHLRATGITDVELWIVNRPGFDPKPYNQAVLDNSFKDEIGILGKGRQLHGPDVSVVAEAEKRIRGIVKDIDTGKGRPNVLVELTQIGEDPQNLKFGARTDAEGRYEIRGARKTKSYLLAVPSDPATGHMSCHIRADDTPGYQPIVADLGVKKGVIITGKMLDGTTGKPIAGYTRVDVLLDNPFAKRQPQFENAGWNPVGKTDADGVFRVVSMPGPVLLMGGPSVSEEGDKYKHSVPDPKYPQYFHKRPNYVAYYHLNDGWSPVQGNFFKVLDLQPDTKIVEQNIVLERAPALTVHIQDADGKPLHGAYVTGTTTEGHWPNPCEKDECSAYSIQPGKPRSMLFYHARRKLIGAITLQGDEKPPVVKLKPFGALKGRLRDANGKPLAGILVNLYYRHPNAETMHNLIHEVKSIVSDAHGDFTVEEVIPEFPFVLTFRRGRRPFERTTKPAEATLPLQSGASRDLGALKLKPLAVKPGE